MISGASKIFEAVAGMKRVALGFAGVGLLVVYNSLPATSPVKI